MNNKDQEFQAFNNWMKDNSNNRKTEIELTMKYSFEPEIINLLIYFNDNLDKTIQKEFLKKIQKKIKRFNNKLKSSIIFSNTSWKIQILNISYNDSESLTNYLDKLELTHRQYYYKLKPIA
jgi:hypothetical protein